MQTDKRELVAKLRAEASIQSTRPEKTLEWEAADTIEALTSEPLLPGREAKDWSDPCVDPECCTPKLNADDIVLLIHEEAQCACGQIENIPYLAVQICERIERQGWKTLPLLEIGARLADEQSENWTSGTSGHAASLAIAKALRALIPAQPRTEPGELTQRDCYDECVALLEKHQVRPTLHVAGAATTAPTHHFCGIINAMVEFANQHATISKMETVHALANGGERIPIHGGGVPVKVDADFIDSVASFAVAASGREQGSPCEACGKPVEIGQVVLMWDDAETHADCDNPWRIDVQCDEDEPEPCVLLGSPMRLHRLSLLSTPDHDCRDQVGAILDDAGQETGYHRTENGEIVTLGDEYDDECAGCDTGCPSCAHLPHRPRGG